MKGISLHPVLCLPATASVGRSAGWCSASTVFLSRPLPDRSAISSIHGHTPSGFHFWYAFCKLSLPGRGGLPTFHSLPVTTTARPPLLLLLQPGGSLRKPARRGSPFPSFLYTPFISCETASSLPILPFLVVSGTDNRSRGNLMITTRYFPGADGVHGPSAARNDLLT